MKYEELKNNLNAYYCEKFDAYYDKEKDEWLEKACDDPKCWYCPGRPEKPSMVKKEC